MRRSCIYSELPKKKLWEVLSVILATLLVIIIGGRDIALAQSAAINNVLGVTSSEIDRSEDEAYQYYKSEFSSYAELSAAWAKVSEEVEGEGIVLLKNDNNALPLEKGDGISTFLTGSAKLNYATSGSSAANTSNYLNLREALEGEGFKLNSALWYFYSEQKGRKKSGETYKINELGYDGIDAAALADLSSCGTALLTFAKYSGKEAAEVYLSKPYTDYDKQNGVEKAAEELVGFAKTGILAPGASERVSVEVSREQLKSYDRNGCKTYIVDAGSCYLTVANGAHEAVNNVLAKKGHTPESTAGRMDAAGNADLVCVAEAAALDSATYAVSSHTGNAITNQLDFADLNKYEGSDTTVTYVSRSDWQGTWPKGAIEITVGDRMNEDLKSNRPIVDGPNGLTASEGSLPFTSEGIWASTFNNDIAKRVGELLAEDALNIDVVGLYANGVNILRGEWAFDGYSITDMASSNGASYMTWQDGILLGTDLFLGSGSENALDEFKSSAAYAQRMREASHRILYTIANYSAAMNGISPDMSIGAATWWWKTVLDVSMYALGALTAAAWVLWILAIVKEKKK